MELTRLDIDRIRCLREAELEPTKGINLLVGANGQGKTSILEAVAILAEGRSFRTRRSSFLAWGARGGRVGGEVRSDRATRRLDAIFDGGKKSFLVDRRPAEGLVEYLGHLGYVAFSSDSLNVICGGPSERRRFLDHGIMGLTPAYIEIYRRYARALRQRNAALQAHSPDLQPWNETLSRAGLPVVRRRRRYVELLSERVHRLYAEIAGGAEELEIRYRPHVPWSEDWEVGFRRRLRSAEERDRRRGQTLAGPHRDELEITFAGRSVREYGSRGQQRGVALAMKLAEFEIFTDERGEAPVLLLDDITSELDRIRTRLLFTYLTGKPQVLVASTDRESLDGLPGVVRRFHVQNGSVCLEA